MRNRNIYEVKFLFNDTTSAKCIEEADTEVEALTNILETWGPPKPIIAIEIQQIEYFRVKTNSFSASLEAE